MGTVLASAVIDDARRLLQDTSNASQRWSDPVLLAALNEAQLALTAIKPAASTITATVELAADSRQSIPTDGLSVVRVLRNMGATGTERGRSVALTTIDELDMSDPDWHNDTGTSVFQYALDDREPKIFYVYPNVTGFIDLTYVQVPATVALITDPISVDDVFTPALARYVAFTALTQDMDSQANQQVATGYYTQFVGLVTGRLQADTLNSPNVN